MKKSKKLMIMGLSAATAAVAATGAVSSFAWFATNDTVTATGMTLKATTSEYLEIKGTGDSDTWNTALALSAEKEVSPVHLNGVSNGGSKTTEKTLASLTDYTDGSTAHDWVSAKADKATASGKKDGDAYDVVTNDADDAAEDSTKNKYTLIKDFDLRVHYLTADTKSTFTISALVDWANTESFDNKEDAYSVSSNNATTNYYFHNSARVLIVVGTYNQETNSVASQGTNMKGYTFSSAADSTGTSGDWSDEAKNIITDLKMDTNGADKKGSGVRVRVFYYFDGEDANCFTDSVTLGRQYSINLTFKVTKNAASGN